MKVTHARALAFVTALLVASPALAVKKELPVGERIDLNRASIQELVKLPGIGRARAKAITARRERTPFRRVDDVLAVKGIKRKWLEKQRAHLEVTSTRSSTSPTTPPTTGHAPTPPKGAPPPPSPAPHSLTPSPPLPPRP